MKDSNRNIFPSVRLKHIVMLSLLIVCAAGTKAFTQSLANYTSARSTGITYSSIISTGESIEAWRNGAEGNYNLDDNRSEQFPIGFDFWYDGKRYTQMSVSTNGFVDFSSETWDGGPGIGATQYNPFGPYSQDLVDARRSSSSGGNGTVLALAPFYYDLTTKGTGDPLGNSIKRQISGTAPYRVLTIEWYQMAAYTNQNINVNFQLKLYETTGIIEFIYGTMTGTIPSGYGFGYSLGINGESLLPNPPTAAQLKVLQTANSTTFSNGQQYKLYTMVTSNSMYRFTPPTPAAPTNLNFTAVTESSMTLTWQDNASNEVGYAIYNSEDGVNYVYATQVSENSTSANVNSLKASTTYYWKVYAVSEGTLSAPVSGTRATAPATSYVSAQSGLWTTGSTWVGGVVPTSYSNVTIANGHTVIYNTSITLNSLTVGQSGSATLRIGNDATARSLTVIGNMTINYGATFDVNTSYAQTNHTLTLKGNLVNNGTFDLAPNLSSQAKLVFNKGSGLQSVSGNGMLTRVGVVNVNVGSSSSDLVDIFSSNFTVAMSNFLTLQNGTLRLSTPVTVTAWTASASIPSSAGLWLNNPDVVFSITGGNLIVSGLLRVTNGTLNVGNAADQRLLYSGGTFVIEGGAVNIAGRLERANVTTLIRFSMSGGTITAPTVSSTSTTSAPVTFNVAGSRFEWYGGRIVIQREGGNGSQDLGYINSLSYNTYVSGGALQIGNYATPSGQTMQINTLVPIYNFIDSSANATATIVTGDLTIRNDVTIVGGTFNANGFNITAGGNWISTGSFVPGTGTVTFNGTGTQTINRTNGETFNNVVINKPSSMASLGSNVTINGTLTLTAGTLAVNSSTLTLNGAITSSGTITSNTDGTVAYNQASAGQTILGANYGNLTLNAYSKNFPSAVIGVAGTMTAPNPATAHVVTGNTIFYNGTANQTLAPTTANFKYNNLRIGAGGTKTAGGAMTVGGNIAVDSAAILACGANAVTVNGNVVNNGTVTGSGSGGIVLAGGSAAHTLSGYGLYGALALNDAQGAVTSGSLKVNGALTLTSGILATGSDTVQVLSGGSVTRSNGFVNGNLQKYISTGSSTVTFEIGDTTRYAPVIVQFYNTTAGGSLLAFTVPSEHPDIMGSAIEPTNSVNRYWTLNAPSLAFDSAWVTLNFVSTDADQPDSTTKYIVNRLDGTTWETPLIGSRTTTSTQARSIHGFGDFIVGGQLAANSYRTRATGNWNVTGTWERFDGTNWVAVTTTPTNSNSVSIRIRNGHTVTVNNSISIDQTIIEDGGTVAIGNVTLTIADGSGTDLTVYGTLQSSSNNRNMSVNGTIQFASGGTYQHRRNGGAIPTATWDAKSNCNITGVTNTIPSGINQTFGNFTWNCSGHTGNLYLQSNMTVTGDFNVLGTGTNDPANNSLRISNNNNGYTISVLGNFNISNNATFKMNNNTGACTLNIGGSLNISGTNTFFCIVTGNANSVVNVNGNVNVTGGTLCLTEESTYGTLNVVGNYSHTAGTVSQTTASYGVINFNGTSMQIYTSGGTVTGDVRFIVNSGSYLQMADASTTITGGGTFTLSSGATLGIRSTSGITISGANGNIQVTGTRTFNTGANYIYNGTAAQVTGNGLPNTVNKLVVDNTAGATLTNSTTVSDSLKLINGTFNIGNNTLRLNSAVYRVNGNLQSNTAGTVIYNQSSNGQNVLGINYGNLTFSNANKILPDSTVGISNVFNPGTATGHTIAGNTIEFNGASQTIPAFTYNKLRVSGSGTKTLGGAITVIDSLMLISGTFDDGGYTLTARGAIVNNIAHVGNGKIVINGASFAVPVSGVGTFTNVELNNPTYGAVISGDKIINGTLTLTAGILYAPSDTVIIASTGNISRPVTGGYVRGYLRKTINTSLSPVTYKLEVGDENSYAPIDLTFMSVSQAGTVTGNTVGSISLGLRYSGLDSAKTVRRQWSLLMNGVEYSTYDGTFNFVASDVPTEANTAYFSLRYNSNNEWFNAVENVRSSLSTKGVGLTGCGIFVVGEITRSVYWTGAAGTPNWGDDRNWSILEAPGNINTVLLDKAVNVVINVPARAQSVSIVNDFVNLQISSGNYLKADTLDINGGTLDVENSNLDSITVVDFSDGTVQYSATNTAQEVRNTAYNVLELLNGGTKTAEGALTILDTLRIGSGTTFDVASYTATVSNDIVNSGSQVGTGAIVLTGGTDSHSIAGSGSFTNLILNDLQGATVSGAVTTVNGTLTLTSGVLSLASDNDTLVVSSTGAINRTDGYVVGNLKMYVAAGASEKIFPLGVGSNYVPVRVQFSDVAQGGYILVKRFNGEHPQSGVSSAIIDTSQDVNVYWSIIPYGITLNGPYSVTLSFVNPNELDSGVDPTSSAVVGALWNSSQWTETSIASRSSENVQLINLFAFGDIVLGKPIARLFISVRSGNWNESETWSPSGVPGTKDTAIVRASHTVTLQAQANITKIVVDGEGTLNVDVRTLNVSGNITINGTITGTGTLHWTTDDDTLDGNGSATGTLLLQISGNKIVRNSANLTLYAISIDAGKSLKNYGSLTLTDINGADATSVFQNGENANLNVAGSLLPVGTLDASAVSNSVSYISTNDQTIKPATYYNLTIVNNGVKSVSSDITVNNNLTLEYGTTLSIGTNVKVKVLGRTITSGALINNGQLILSD